MDFTIWSIPIAIPHCGICGSTMVLSQRGQHVDVAPSADGTTMAVAIYREYVCPSCGNDTDAGKLKKKRSTTFGQK